VTSGKSDLNDAGYNNWRWEKSKAGAIAYKRALKNAPANLHWDEVVKRAWRAFWNAGIITRVRQNGVTVTSPANGQEQKCDWGLTNWKIKNGEIYLSSEDRQRLKELLQEKGWGRSLVAQL
jgi:hypothetical protein